MFYILQKRNDAMANKCSFVQKHWQLPLLFVYYYHYERVRPRPVDDERDYKYANAHYMPNQSQPIMVSWCVRALLHFDFKRWQHIFQTGDLQLIKVRLWYGLEPKHCTYRILHCNSLEIPISAFMVLQFMPSSFFSFLCTHAAAAIRS